jgi:hypothetical protein
VLDSWPHFLAESPTVFCRTMAGKHCCRQSMGDIQII